MKAEGLETKGIFTYKKRIRDHSIDPVAVGKRGRKSMQEEGWKVGRREGEREEERRRERERFISLDSIHA